METIVTERLILRKFKEEDLQDFYEYAKVSGVGEAAGWCHHESLEESKEILESFINDDEVRAIVEKSSGKVIGSIGIHKSSLDPTYPLNIQRELGYVLSKDYWGLGFATEASKAVIDYAFTKDNVDCLWCGHFDTNDKSKRVIEKCGFKFYKSTFYNANQLGKQIESKIYLMTKDDYLKMKENK